MSLTLDTNEASADVKSVIDPGVTVVHLFSLFLVISLLLRVRGTPCRQAGRSTKRPPLVAERWDPCRNARNKSDSEADLEMVPGISYTLTAVLHL